MRASNARKRSAPLERVLQAVERFGNRIPDSFTLFLWIIGGLIVLSVALSLAGAAVESPATHQTIAVKSLLSAEALRWFLVSVMGNFTEFPPFGLIVVLAMGVGVAQRTGLLETTIHHLVLGIPRWCVTLALVFICFFSHVASDVALLIMPAIGAMVFRVMGRHPLAGLCVAMAAVGGGYSANFIIVGLDVVMAGLSTSAARIANPDISVSPVDNWYFMVCSVFVLASLAVLITERVVEPRLGLYRGSTTKEVAEGTPRERRALRVTGLVVLVLVALIAAAVALPHGILRDPKTDAVIGSPFLKGIAPLLFCIFVIAGTTYGAMMGTIRRPKDVGALIGQTVRELGGFIVLMFLIANFTAALVWSNIGVVAATAGAHLLIDIGLTGAGAQFMLMAIGALVVIVIPSSSAAWALLAPLFVPMFMLLGYQPAFTQLAMRVGLCSFIPISPINPFVPAAVKTGQEYVPDLTYGQFLSIMVPYVVSFMLAWPVLYFVFYAFNLPIGPGITPRF